VPSLVALYRGGEPKRQMRHIGGGVSIENFWVPYDART